MAQNVKPTRSELMNVKKKIKLAGNGYNLLKKKRDGLILEFFEIMKKAKELRGELNIDYKNATKQLNIARTLESELYIKALSLAITQQPEITLETKNIMGLKLPKIEAKRTASKKFSDRGYGIVSGSSMIDEAANGFESVVDKAIQIAETEIAMKKILEEIEKTKRRVNALEFEVIPKLNEQKAFISLRLEEMERENTFRMKRIKAKSEA